MKLHLNPFNGVSVLYILFSFLFPYYSGAQNGGPCDPIILNYSKKVNNFSAAYHNYDLNCGVEFNESVVFFKYIAPYDIDSLNLRITYADPVNLFDSIAVAFYKNFDCTMENYPEALHCTKQFSKSFVHEYFDIKDGDNIVVAIGAPEGHQGEFRLNIYQNLEMADSCQDIQLGSKLDFEIYWPDWSEETYICQESTLEYALPDSLFDGYDFSQNPTVWLKMDYSGEDYKTQLFSHVESYGSWRPVWSLFYGSCDSLINAGNFDNTNNLAGYGDSTIHWVAAESSYDPYVYVAVTADPNGPPIDDPGFRLCGVPIINVETCLGAETGDSSPDPTTEIIIVDREYADLEPDYDPEKGYMGPFLPGEEVQVHIEFFYDARETENDKFYGFVPDFGLGWDLESVDFEDSHPHISGANHNSISWHEYGTDCAAILREAVPHLCTYEDLEGTVRLCNAIIYYCGCDELGMDLNEQLPNSYFWMADGESASCDQTSCNPGYHESLAAQTTMFRWDFDIKVEEFNTYEEKVMKKDLRIGFQTLSQGGAGCWEDALGKCLIDRSQRSINYKVDIISNNYALKDHPHLEVSPNPFYNDISIKTKNQDSGNCVMRIINSQGYLAYKNSIYWKNGQEHYKLNTNGLNPGFYTLELIMGGKIYREKLLKLQ